MEELSLLILGAGWTGTFLIPLLQSRGVSFAATTTTGRPVAGVPTLRFKFDPSAPEEETYSAIAALPRARCVLITFPLQGRGPSKLLMEAYDTTHRRGGSDTAAAQPTSQSPSHLHSRFRFIQLGSTGIWQQAATTTTGSSKNNSPWLTRHSVYDRANPRAVAEDELLSLGGCVLNLAGLWGGERDPRRWARRVAASKEAVRAKTSLHLVHGADVARAIAAVAGVAAAGGEGREEEDRLWDEAGRGQRWMVTDGFVYDWWALLAGWADVGGGAGGEGAGGGGDDGETKREREPSEQARWVFELMREEGVRALPRGPDELGRCYDSREFWETFRLVPLKGRVY